MNQLLLPSSQTSTCRRHISLGSKSPKTVLKAGLINLLSVICFVRFNEKSDSLFFSGLKFEVTRKKERKKESEDEGEDKRPLRDSN